MADNFYEVTLTSGTVLGDVFDASVANTNTDTSLTSLELIRRGANAYAEPTSLNLVHMVEHFADATSPANPLTGQLWYDTVAKKMKVYDAGFLPIDGSGLATGLANAVTISLTGDVTGSASFDGSNATNIAATLNPTGITPGTYSMPVIVVDAGGRITSAVTANVVSNAGGVITGDLTISNASLDVSGSGKVKEDGFALIPRGMIVMWWGNAGTVPGGWLLCNGVGGLTPNLSGRFIVGLDPGGGYNLDTTGGSSFQNGVSVSSSGGHIHDVQMATAGSHNHLGTTGTHVLTAAELPAHTHGLTAAGVPLVGTGFGYSGTSGVTGVALKQTESTGNGVGHNHTIASSGDHTHTANTLTGGEHIHTITSFDNRPPFYSLAYIMKT